MVRVLWGRKACQQRLGAIIVEEIFSKNSGLSQLIIGLLTKISKELVLHIFKNHYQNMQNHRLGTNRNCLIVIMEYTQPRLLIQCQSISHSFYDQIVPKAMWRTKLFAQISELRHMSTFVNDPHNLTKARKILRELLQFMEYPVQFTPDKWPLMHLNIEDASTISVTRNYDRAFVTMKRAYDKET